VPASRRLTLRGNVTAPITGIAGCCARAPSGHAAAAPPSSDMNSRRLIGSLSNRGPQPSHSANMSVVHYSKVSRRLAAMVKMRRTRIEHILSALPPLATEERTFGIGSSVS
jgi:hypothetical protein